MISIYERLEGAEIAGVRALVGELSHALGENLLAAWLFGSKARGDGHSRSDIDVFIVVEQLEPSTRWQVRELAADSSLDYDILINTHILSRARWVEHTINQSALWRELLRDGIPLLESVQALV